MLNLNSKKILIILIGILVLAIFALLVYNFSFIKEKEPKEGQENKEEQTPDTRISKISKEPVAGAILSGGDIKYSMKQNGNIFQTDPKGGQKEQIFGGNLSQMLEISWSTSQEKAITSSKKPNSFDLSKHLYNFRTKTLTPLNSNIRDFDWAPTKDKIAYQYYNRETDSNTHISIANADGGNWKNILTIPLKNLLIDWIKPDRISFRTRPTGLAESAVYTADIETKNFQKVASGFGLSVLWSPSGDKLLYSQTNDRGKDLKLKLKDLTENSTEDINIKTIPEKCVWNRNNEVIYCAVPRDPPYDAVLPDDFYKQKISSADSFWRIDTRKETARKIFEPNQNFNATKLLVSEREGYLFFIDQKDKSLYSLEL